MAVVEELANDLVVVVLVPSVHTGIVVLTVVVAVAVLAAVPVLVLVLAPEIAMALD